MAITAVAASPAPALAAGSPASAVLSMRRLIGVPMDPAAPGHSFLDLPLKPAVGSVTVLTPLMKARAYISIVTDDGFSTNVQASIDSPEKIKAGAGQFFSIGDVTVGYLDLYDSPPYTALLFDSPSANARVLYRARLDR